MKNQASEAYKKVYAPSRFVVDPDDDTGGSKWRIAVACAVLNSRNELLVGERSRTKDAWQAPQGGVDGAWERNNFQEETIAEAAARELYEEMGLRCKQHVILVDQDTIEPVRYDTSGDNWLTRSGFTGQELHWCIFRCTGGRGDTDANLLCDLSGNNGEEAEFSRAQWMPIKKVVDEMWPGKQGPYKTLQKSLPSIVRRWESNCDALDFTGMWSRDASMNENAIEAYVARGIPLEKATRGANEPYIQQWTRGQQNGSQTIWNVKTFDKDNLNVVRRDLDYRIAQWKELFLGDSLLFNSESGGFLERQTAFVAEPQADEKVAHVTITKTPGEGVEESRRYIKNDQMILRRTFWADENVAIAHGIHSTEVFLRINIEK
eukprot:CAMPEP_0198147390 /NCGR_PEP_ID=MMETSP1443-20131203/35296_1 /TAXON_ID=186043 /ORGANISM="Entomoneis sp., Strain CCMP2396" /LENGTH=375 /DNA_ID=CAMNT_0043811701 /DNA_START=85 /DNA_END=1212 /DNA_ORIENTATION=+